MTHPIHSADAEREVLCAALCAAFEADYRANYILHFDKDALGMYKDSEMARAFWDWKRSDRAEAQIAAAQVGANGAAVRERSPYVLGVKPSNWAEQVAAGAPAETIEQARANFENWYVTHIDGSVIGSADCAARWSSWLAGSTGQYKAPSDWKIAPMPWGAPAETPKPDAEAELLDMLGRIHPFAMDGADNTKEKWSERLRRPFCIQQPWPVPDQACIVWRADLMHMANDLTHKQAFFDEYRDRPDAAPAATIGAGEGKDALDAARWRYVRDTETLLTTVWEALEGTDCAPDGVLDRAAYAAGMDRAVDAAMRSKTSPGEAG